VSHDFWAGVVCGGSLALAVLCAALCLLTIVLPRLLDELFMPTRRGR
jgi:hypothetical protein